MSRHYGYSRSKEIYKRAHKTDLCDTCCDSAHLRHKPLSELSGEGKARRGVYRADSGRGSEHGNEKPPFKQAFDQVQGRCRV